MNNKVETAKKHAVRPIPLWLVLIGSLVGITGFKVGPMIFAPESIKVVAEDLDEHEGEFQEHKGELKEHEERCDMQHDKLGEKVEEQKAQTAELVTSVAVLETKMEGLEKTTNDTYAAVQDIARRMP